MIEYLHQTYAGLQVRDVAQENCTFIDCDFIGCSFEKVRLRQFEFENCRFTDSSIGLITQSFMRMNDVIFRNCFIQGVSLNGLTIPHSLSFYDCRLSLVDFINLALQNSAFSSCSFKECSFEDCNLKKSCFTNSAFSYCEFRRTDLSDCDFSDTEGLDINHEINIINNIKLPQTAGNKILKRMGISIS